MRKIVALLAGAALMLITTSAMALPIISGSIHFTGMETLTPAVPGTNISNATGLDFSGAVVNVATGTYAPIPTPFPSSTLATFTDFTFNPLTPAGVNPLWTLTYNAVVYSFDLETINIDVQTDTALDLSGTGILHVTDYEDTPGTWLFSSQGRGLTFSAQSAVPEPGTMLLLGAGFLGLAIYGKRRKNA